MRPELLLSIIASAAFSLPATSMGATAPTYPETEVTVGATGWPLPGILTLPISDQPVAVAVLIHGSGPQDADGTIFANTPLRDIAQGLADRGIGTLRYVKRSKAHGARMAREVRNITAKGEVVDDAVAAIRWLRNQPGVADDRIFVLGHSLGAMLAPRIAQAAGSDVPAGLILLAGNARPLEDVALEQIRYLAPTQGISDAQMTEFEQQHDRVKALLRGETIDGPLLLGVPASYWRDLSSNDPVAIAQTLDLPMLILQGERDYQVTMQDFDRWREGLANRDNIVFRSYPELNHLFIPGNVPSLPAEYFVAGHVDLSVIDDIAEWIRSGLRNASSRSNADTSTPVER